MRVRDRGTAGGIIRYSLRPDQPPGVAINEQTGVLSWTPETPGSYFICVVATDAENLTDETTLSVEVKHLKQRPQLAPIPPWTVAVGRRAVLVVSASDPDAPRDRLRFSLVDAPDWVKINPASGVVSCTVPQEQAGEQCEVTVRVEDDSPTPLFDEQMLTIRVAGQVREPVPVPQTGFHLTFPSGRSLNDSDVEPARRGQTGAKELWSKALQRNINWYPRYPGTNSMEAISDCAKDAMDGPTVFFYANRDPRTCYQRGNFGFNVQAGRTAAGSQVGGFNFLAAPTPAVTTSRPTANMSKKRGYVPKTLASRTPTDGDFWNDVAVWFYANYHGGGWNGRVAAWDEAGKQKFFGEYKLNRLDGVSCLFENGDLSAVAEYEHGGVQAVHRIAAGKIQESFNDPKQAGALIREIAAEESTLKGESASVRNQMRDYANKLRAEVHKRNQAAADRKRAAAEADFQRTVKGFMNRARGN